MKTFLMIVGAIVIIVLGIVMYLYQNITYQPEHIEVLEEFDSTRDEEEAFETYEKVKLNLKEDGFSTLTSADLINLFKHRLIRETDKRAVNAFKKINCQIEDNVLTIETVVDIGSLTKSKFSKKIQPVFDLINQFATDGGVNRDLYLSFEGEPYYDNGYVSFRGKPVFRIGDFSQEVSIDKHEKNIDLEEIVLNEINISDFEMAGDKIKIFR